MAHNFTQGARLDFAQLEVLRIFYEPAGSSRAMEEKGFVARRIG